MSDPRPGLIGRLLARLQGEYPATELEAYRRAGADVYALVEDLEVERMNRSLEELDSWSVPEATQAALLCGWNAFVLQVLGDRLLDADYESEPATAGYLPPVTAQQTLGFYSQVPQWLSRARQASASPSFRLDVHVPAALPGWSEVEPCPVAHLAAMRAALDHLRRQTSAARAGFRLDLDHVERRRAHDRIVELLAEAEAAASYSDRLWAPAVPAAVHEVIEQHAKIAIECFYEAGQLLCMPRLALEAPPRIPGPGRRDFDPWRLTDPDSRMRWQGDPEARRAIEALWASDPNPDRTLAIQADIEAAAAGGLIVRLPGVGMYFCCPWAPIWLVKVPVTLGGQPLRALEQFTYDVSAEEMAEGGSFVRRILVGNFRPTDEVDYCIPGEGHDD